MIINDLILKTEKIKAHVDNQEECPRCESRDVHAESVIMPNYDLNGEERYPTQEFHCRTCGMSWEDVYKLIGIRILDKGALESREDCCEQYSLYLYKKEDT